MDTSIIGMSASIDEVSQRTGYSTDTVRAMVQRGKLHRFTNGMFSAVYTVDAVLAFESDPAVRERVLWWKRELEGTPVSEIPERFRYFDPQQRHEREQAAVEASKSDVERYKERVQVVFDCVATVDQRTRDIAVYEQEIKRNQEYLQTARQSLAEAETKLKSAIQERDRYKPVYDSWVKAQIEAQSDEPKHQTSVQSVAGMHREDALDIEHQPVRRGRRSAVSA